MSSTKTVELNKQVFPYIIGCIDADAHDLDVLPESDADKLRFLHDTFLAEKGWHIERVGKYKAFEEWLQGLPSVFNIAWENYRILEIAREWGSIPVDASARAEQKILDNYWNFMTAKTFQLFKKHGIDA